VQVEPLYDWSNYCVVALRLSQSSTLGLGGVQAAPKRPDGIDNTLMLVSVIATLQIHPQSHGGIATGQCG
jgi:hypothetical protein